MNKEIVSQLNSNNVVLLYGASSSGNRAKK